MQSTVCVKCNTAIQIWKKSDIIKCKACGSVYNLQSSTIGDQHIDYTFVFSGFECMHTSISESCDSLCLAPGMYCKEHVSDKSFSAAKNSIIYAQQRLENTKEVLERMEESKKLWLIQEVSGINEQDNSIRKDEDGQD